MTWTYRQPHRYERSSGLYVPRGETIGTYYFQDEFDGTSLDLDKWTVINRIEDQSNSEIGCDVPAMVTVANGEVILRSEVNTQSCGDAYLAPTSQNYRSGHIQMKKPAFLYGTIDVRAKFPGGTGLWPIIWMLGRAWQANQPDTANIPGSDWPNGEWCEVDIAECLGGERTTPNMQIHNGANHPGAHVNVGFDVSTQYAVFRTIWSAGSMEWQVNSEDGRGFRSMQIITGAAVPAVPMYLVLSTAIGGVGGGTPNDATFPQEFKISYVRITSDSVAPVSASPVPPPSRLNRFTHLRM